LLLHSTRLLTDRISFFSFLSRQLFSPEWYDWFVNVDVGKSFQQSANASIAAIPEKKEASDQNLATVSSRSSVYLFLLLLVRFDADFDPSSSSLPGSNCSRQEAR